MRYAAGEHATSRAYLLHRVGDRDLHDRAAVSACCTAGVPMVFIALKQDGIIIGRCTH